MGGFGEMGGEKEEVEKVLEERDCMMRKVLMR